MQYTNKIHETNKLIRQVAKCFKMLINWPVNRINTIILWNIIKPTKSLQFIGMWKQFVAGRYSNFVKIRQFRNELQFFEMMNMDEIINNKSCAYQCSCDWRYFAIILFTLWIRWIHFTFRTDGDALDRHSYFCILRTIESWTVLCYKESDLRGRWRWRRLAVHQLSRL